METAEKPRGGSVYGGKRDQARAIGEDDRAGVDLVRTGFDVEVKEEVLHFEGDFAGLAAGGGDDEDEGVWLRDESMRDEDGSEGRFSPLAVAVEGHEF